MVSRRGPQGLFDELLDEVPSHGALWTSGCVLCSPREYGTSLRMAQPDLGQLPPLRNPEPRHSAVLALRSSQG